MTNRTRQQGFTLIEILVAVALISTVLSMVYGTYVTTTRSAQACKTRIVLCREGRTTLEQIARHIRCSYAGSEPEPAAEDVEAGSDRTQVVSVEDVEYFNGNAKAQNGEILHLVTASGLSDEKGLTDGLFDVVYRFNKRTGELALSLARFVGTTDKTAKRQWWPIADRITSVDMEFFDGDKWFKRWDSSDNKGLPRAVRIEISGENESLQRYNYGTVAYVSCRGDRALTQTETLASAEKQ